MTVKMYPLTCCTEVVVMPKEDRDKYQVLEKESRLDSGSDSGYLRIC